MRRLPYFKLSGFYFFYFASMGAFLPYWGLYLKTQGFEPDQIGHLMAVIQGTKIIAPNVWGWLADRSGRRAGIIKLGAMLSLLLFSGITFAAGYWWLIAVMALFSFFWNAVLPQFEITTLRSLGEETHRYSHVRLWGSVGFIVSVAGLAPVLERFGMSVLPWLVTALLFALWLNSLTIREGADEATDQRPNESLCRTLRYPAVLLLLLSAFFSQASHGPYYTFFTIYLEEFGYSRSAAGQLWALGVLAEVGIFLILHRWLPRFGEWRLLLAALFLTTVRWIAVATLVTNPILIVAAQTLHAASFGVFHVAAINLIFRYFPASLQGRGQALYASLSFGLGGALGSSISGYVWLGMGGPWVFGFGAMLAAAGLACAALGMVLSRNIQP